MASPTALSRRPSGRPQRVLDTISPEVARSIGTAEAKLRKILNSAKQKKKFSTAAVSGCHAGARRPLPDRRAPRRFRRPRQATEHPCRRTWKDRPERPFFRSGRRKILSASPNFCAAGQKAPPRWGILPNAPPPLTGQPADHMPAAPERAMPLMHIRSALP